jgi:hypothetical protein
VLPASVRFPLLFATAVVAGLVDSIAGGGGLVTVPVLLAVGIPPQLVLGTNKLQSSCGSFTATWHYFQEGLVDLRDASAGIVATAAGAIAGAWSVQQLSSAFLNRAIPIVLIAIAIYTLGAGRFGHADGRAHMRRTPFFLVFGLSLGFYDGFFGPGTGSFWAVAFVAVLGMNLMRATAYTKLMNFTSNIVSLVLFLAGGHVLFHEGLTMAAGQIIGARLGAGMAVRRGAGFIRPIFIIVVMALAIQLLVRQIP